MYQMQIFAAISLPRKRLGVFAGNRYGMLIFLMSVVVLAVYRRLVGFLFLTIHNVFIIRLNYNNRQKNRLRSFEIFFCELFFIL